MPRFLDQEELSQVFGQSAPVRQPRASVWDYAGAAVDSLQSNLAAIPASMGSDYFDDLRLGNKVEADQTRERYFQTNPGAARGLRDANFGNAAGLLGRTALDSLPTMGGIAAGGLLGGVPGAIAAGSIAGTGDVLSNQYDEAGRGDLGTAAPLGLAYGTVDALTGLGGAMLGRGLTKTGIRALDNLGADKLAGIGGWGGTAARTAAGGAKGFVTEGAGETFQEGMNQLGRMAVNEDQTLFNEDANDRYLESFVLGGALGGVVGGWRRSEGFAPEQPKPTVEQQPDLLDRARPEFQLSSYGQDEGPLFGAESQQEGQPSAPYNDPRQMNLMSGVNEMVNGVPVELTQDELTGNQLPFLPPDMTPQFELGSGAQQPYQGGFDFEPVGVNAPTLGLQPGRMSGAQLDMFGGPDTFGEAAPAPAQPSAPEYQDTQTRDMLMDTPSAMVPTMLNPSTEPTYQVIRGEQNKDGTEDVGQMDYNPPKSQGGIPNKPVSLTGSLGAVAANIRSQMVQRLGSADAYTTKLSFGLAQNLNSVETAVAWLDTQAAALDKEQVNLDKQADRDIIDPDEYATKREQLENKRVSLMAAEELVGQMRKARQDALVQEAMGKVQPGAVVGQAPTNDVAVQQQVEKNQQVQMDSALETTDAKVAEGMRRQTGNERADILASVLDANPPAGQVLMRFNQALRGAGFTKLANAEEVSTLKAYLNTVKAAEPEVEPSAPNEMDVYEQPKAKAAPAPQPKPPVQPPAAPSGRAAPEPAAATKATSTPAPAPVAAKPAPAPVASASKQDAVAPAKASGSKPVSVLKSDGEQAVVDLRKRLSVLQQLKACLAS